MYLGRERIRHRHEGWLSRAGRDRPLHQAAVWLENFRGERTRGDGFRPLCANGKCDRTLGRFETDLLETGKRAAWLDFERSFHMDSSSPLIRNQSNHGFARLGESPLRGDSHAILAAEPREIGS